MVKETRVIVVCGPTAALRCSDIENDSTKRSQTQILRMIQLGVHKHIDIKYIDVSWSWEWGYFWSLVLTQGTATDRRRNGFACLWRICFLQCRSPRQVNKCSSNYVRSKIEQFSANIQVHESSLNDYLKTHGLWLLKNFYQFSSLSKNKFSCFLFFYLSPMFGKN